MPSDTAYNISNVIYQNVIKHKKTAILVLALIVTTLILISYQFDLFNRLESITLDQRFQLRHFKPGSSDVVFIDMAEDSVNVIGRWPWPRKWHAALIKILSSYDPKAIVFDVIFSEAQDDADDGAMEEAIRQSGVVYIPSVYDIETDKSAGFYEGIGVTAIHEPLPRFSGVMKGSGHVNTIPDPDGTLRRVPPVLRYKDKTSYQLGIRVGSDILGFTDKDISIDPHKHNMRFTRSDGKVEKMPLDSKNQLLVNWLGKWGTAFKHYSYLDVIKSYAAIKEGKKPIIDLNEFKGKVCIIGLTAIGLIDIKPVPVDNAYPAVGTNAMIISSMLKGDFVREPPEGVDLLILILVSIVWTILLCNLRPLSGIFVTVISMSAYYIVSVLIFRLFNIAIVTFYPICAIGFSYLVTVAFSQGLQSVERMYLFRQATRDGLTQLYNVRHFNLLLDAEFRNTSTLRSRALSIIMADIDNFKHVNDTFGHSAGDIILREVADTIQAKCRQLDVVGRYGGEEFIVMVSSAKAQDAANIAEKIRLAVEEKKFKLGGVLYSTSISLGVAEYSGEKNKGELVEKADKALYRSKKTGKNKVTIYSSDMQ